MMPSVSEETQMKKLDIPSRKKMRRPRNALAVYSAVPL